MKRRFAVIVLLLTLLVAGVVYGSVLPGVRADLSEMGESRYESVGTAMEVMALIKTRYYYQPVDTFDMIRAYVQKGTITGMLKESLEDPYTRYMDASAFERLMSNTKGEFGGIGIVVGIQDEELTVVAPIKGTPGERGGLRSQDKIIAIDGRDATYMTLEEAVSLMRGPEGEDVTLTIRRGEEVLEIYIVRAIINVESVPEPKILEPGIGYVHITNFSEKTHQELQSALTQLDEADIEALVLDLRFNPGGSLQAAIEVTDTFVAEGPLVYLEDAEGNRSAYQANQSNTRPAMPMVVLINGGSASASEIVSGALQDNQLATLVGTKSFGKGLVQAVYPLRDGSAVTVTEQAYLTSGGRNINEVGIEPDVVVELTEEEEELIYFEDAEQEDRQLNEALAILREKRR